MPIKIEHQDSHTNRMPNQRGLHIYLSNRLEILAGKLAEVVQVPLTPPFEPEIVIVQSKGMERWTSMALARHNGICANISFPFPNTFVQDIIRIFYPELPDRSPYDRDALTFRIMRLLPVCVGQPGFEPLGVYLREDQQGLKLYQLSEKIADLFDQYLVFRPEMIFSWESGSADHWQARIWRRLVSETEIPHRSRLRSDLIRRLDSTADTGRRLPKRVSIFGISYLPEFHMRVFSALSMHISINLFLMNPCREFWSDILTDHEKKRIRHAYQGKSATDKDLHLDTGNRLLAAMGVQGRDFFRNIVGFDPNFSEAYDPPGEKTLLHQIQTDILNLYDRNETAGNRHGKTAGRLKKNDQSIVFHSCHSPMREIETLHNNLLAMFENDPDLHPGDIIVMTPDIDLYAPYIQAVFSAPNEGHHRIPFSIADQSVRRESRLIDGFLSVLDLKGTRFEAPAITALLGYASIRERFDLDESDLEKIEKWVREAGIRWGIDTEARNRLGFPSVSENTWKFGIDRLLLGVAMPGYGRRMFSGILPYDQIEGRDTIILGKFLEFVDRVIHHVDAFSKPRSVAEWGKSLLTLTHELFTADEETEKDIQAIRSQLEKLGEIQELTGFSAAVSLDVVRNYLQSRLETEGAGRGFISGGVTFCAMLPMRSIPFQVVCLIGMNTDAFPRESRRVGFDLIGKYPKPGDRSRRNDDRYLFLEAIISSRRRLYISFVGQDIRDNTRIPPSVLVSELIDYIAEGPDDPDTDIVTRHPLQAFSIDYFNDTQPKLFSYSEEDLAAATSLVGAKATPPFISDRLDTPSDDWRWIDIHQLARFFSHPCRFLLQKRLGIFLDVDNAVNTEKETFHLDPLDEYLFGRDLIDWRSDGMSPDRMKQLLRAGGILPHGNVGEVAFKELYTDANAFMKRINRFDAGMELEPRQVSLEISGFHLFGELGHRHQNGLVRIRYATTKARDFLKAWIFHLICSQTKRETPQNTFLISKDGDWCFSPVENSTDILTRLLTLFWEGLTRPLRFFPESSLAYCRQIAKGKSRKAARMSARRKWEGNPYSGGWGESDDPYFTVCFRSEDPIDEAFENLSVEIFASLLNHCHQYIP